MTLSIFQKGLLVLSLAFLFLFGLMWASMRSHVQHLDAQRRALRASEVLVEGQQVLALLVDIETSVRGFVITYNDDFLEPYDRAVRELDPSLDHLNELVESDPAQLRLAQAATRDARNLVRWHAETLGLARAGQGETAIERSAAAKGRMDELRQMFGALLQVDRRGANAAMAALATAQQRFRILLGSAAVGSVIALIALAVAFNRGISRRLSALVSNCERLAEGRTLLPAADSRDEIGNLDRAFRRMASDLDRQRQMKLQGLTEAAALVVSARQSRSDLLHAVTEKARILMGAHYAESWLAADGDRGTLGTRVWRSAAEPPPGADAQCPQALWAEVRDSGRLARASDGAWRWLAAPLTFRDGSVIGLVATATEGPFKAEDELVLLQLAHIGSVVLQIRHAYERLEQHAEELAALNRDLTQKTQENELFVYSVSHDLRSPLVNLEGFSRELESVGVALRTLLDQPDVPAGTREAGVQLVDCDMREAVHFIRTAVERLGRIIEGLLQLSRAGRVQYRSEPVPLDPILERLVAGMQASISGRAAQVIVQPLGAVRGDAMALDQVFGNLLDNALKYAAAGRAPLVEIGPLDTHERGERVIYVRDNGLGVPETYRDKIFHPLQRIHADAAAGEGLGLAIVRRLVERQGGRIWVESVEGQGSTFFIALGAAELAQDDAQGAGSASHAGVVDAV
jgi:signal transduction histidine kinase/CHASE3 domain sensor protein